MDGLIFKGEFSNTQEREFTDSKGIKRMNFDVWLKIKGRNQKIQFLEDPKLEAGKEYLVKVGVNPYEYTDKDSGEVKRGYSLYAMKDHEPELV